MKKFAYQFLWFSFPLLAFLILLETLLRCIPNDYTFKKNHLDKNVNRIETLVLGSSHALYGINPDLFASRTFNAAHVSQSLDIDYAFLLHYANRFKSLKQVILPVSYFSLFTNLNNGLEKWRLSNYIIYYGFDLPHSFKDNFELTSRGFDMSLKKIYYYFFFNQKFTRLTDLGWNYTNVFSEKHNINALDEGGKVTAKRHTVNLLLSYERDIYNRNLDILNRIASWCNQRRIKLYLFTPPAFHSYVECLNKNQMSHTLEAVNHITETYANAKYYNLLSSQFYTADDFFDADHLTDLGAKKLSGYMDSLTR